MRQIVYLLPILFLSLLLKGCDNEKSTTNKDAYSFTVPVEYFKLKNGLRVVLSKDSLAPVAVVSVYYNIGFRIEPRDRTGFAHLFEHMMFQASKNLEKGEYDKLVESSGGVNNGSTRFDFTNYYSIIPSHKIETMLWAEADKMKGLEINQVNLTNQQEVVKNEVLVNVINQPYGGFPWLDMPQVANENWYNAHNFYGDLSDLDAAKLEDVAQFFNTFYAPNNAVISIVGDLDIEETKAWIEKYFGSIPAVTLPPKPDLSEPRQEKEKIHRKEDKLASKPAIAYAYKMPDRNTPEYYAMGLIDQMLVQGQDSRLHRKLVKEKGYTGSVSGGINYLGNMFNYNGPMLWMFDLTYDLNLKSDSITYYVNQTVDQLYNSIDQKMIDQSIVKMRSDLYDIVGDNFGRADILACFALFDDDPARINNLESEFKKVTPERIRKTIQEYLRTDNRTILISEPPTK